MQLDLKSIDIGKKKWLKIFLLALLILLSFQLFRHLLVEDKNLYSSNGRIEGTEIDIAPRIGQRIKALLVREGDPVEKGQPLVSMNTDLLEAELKEAQAKLLEAASLISISESDLLLRQSEKSTAVSELQRYEAEMENAKKILARSTYLAPKGGASQQEFDNDETRFKATTAARDAARYRVESADAAIASVLAQIERDQATVKAAQAAVQQILIDINDSTLVSPVQGRVQYRVAQTGEIVPPGGRILRILDLSDIYMTFFLPTDLVGRIPIGGEARIVLDAFPDRVIPAYISFISDVAQFTPKNVETKSEREKLMLRLRAQVPKDFLEKNIHQVKTGLPGVAYVRTDNSKPWPKALEIRDDLP